MLRVLSKHALDKCFSALCYCHSIRHSISNITCENNEQMNRKLHLTPFLNHIKIVYSVIREDNLISHSSHYEVPSLAY